jgi:hypothetical protein
MPYFTNSRAAERDVSALKSRAARRKVRKAWKAERDAQRDFERDKRARERIFKTFLQQREAREKGNLTIVRLRSWKQASKIASTAGDLWIRARVALKQFRPRKARTPSGQLAMNQHRMQKVVSGDLLRVGDDHDDKKVRYIRPGLAKKLVRAGMAARDKSSK